MKRMLLIFLILLFFRQIAAAQDKLTDASDHQLSETVLLKSDSFGPAAGDGSIDQNSDSESTSSQAPAGETQTKKTKTPPKPTIEPQMPTPIKRKTEYLDSAIIGSQIRIRFDAAFNMTHPDAAEFFYAKCGCYGDLAPTNALFDPNAPGPGPGNTTQINFQQVYLNVEYALNPRFSVFGEVPFRSIQYLLYGGFPPPQSAANFGNEAGLSDVNAGFKFAFIASKNRVLTLQMQGIFPTGSAAIGAGTGHYSIVPALLYDQQLGQRWAFDAEFSDTHPVGGSAGLPSVGKGGFAGDVLFYGIGPSYELIQLQNFHLAPVLEMVGWSIRGGFQTNLNSGGSASGTNIVNMKWGARVNFGTHSSAYVGFGTALTTARWYRDIWRVEYRYSFGKF
jgi:hypothetical protein